MEVTANCTMCFLGSHTCLTLVLHHCFADPWGQRLSGAQREECESEADRLEEPTLLGFLFCRKPREWALLFQQT